MTTLSIACAVAYPSIATALPANGSEQNAPKRNVLKQNGFAPAARTSLGAFSRSFDATGLFGGADAAMPTAEHAPAGMAPARPWRLPPRESTRL